MIMSLLEGSGMPAREEKYSTISVPVRAKETLQAAKGDMEWGEFLLSIYDGYIKLRRERSHGVLRRMLSEEDLSNIGHSSKRFRRGFKLRGAEKGV